MTGRRRRHVRRRRCLPAGDPRPSIEGKRRAARPWVVTLLLFLTPPARQPAHERTRSASRRSVPRMETD
jgi:hypothetical protein